MPSANDDLAWVHAVERAYVAAATGHGIPAPGNPEHLARARGAIGAVASHYLAVGTPRSFGLIVDVDQVIAARDSLAAHRAWFAPRDVRCAGPAGGETASTVGARATSIEEALACDIVCVHARITILPAQLRRGTHVNLLSELARYDAELAKLASITHEHPGLGELAAGLVDGRQLDELTLFVVGDAAIALGALAAP